jgi:hypothetical protein
MSVKRTCQKRPVRQVKSSTNSVGRKVIHGDSGDEPMDKSGSHVILLRSLEDTTMLQDHLVAYIVSECQPESIGR